MKALFKNFIVKIKRERASLPDGTAVAHPHDDLSGFGPQNNRLHHRKTIATPYSTAPKPSADPVTIDEGGLVEGADATQTMGTAARVRLHVSPLLRRRTSGNIPQVTPTATITSTAPLPVAHVVRSSLVPPAADHASPGPYRVQKIPSQRALVEERETPPTPAAHSSPRTNNTSGATLTIGAATRGHVGVLLPPVKHRASNGSAKDPLPPLDDQGNPILVQLRQPSMSAPGPAGPGPLLLQPLATPALLLSTRSAKALRVENTGGGYVPPLASPKAAPALQTAASAPTAVLHRLAVGASNQGPAHPPPPAASSKLLLTQSLPNSLKDRNDGQPISERTEGEEGEDGGAALAVVVSAAPLAPLPRPSFAQEVTSGLRGTVGRARSLKTQAAFAFDRTTSQHVRDALPEAASADTSPDKATDPLLSADEKKRRLLRHYPTASAAYWENTATEWLQPGAPLQDLGASVPPPLLSTSRRATLHPPY